VSRRAKTRLGRYVGTTGRAKRRLRQPLTRYRAVRGRLAARRVGEHLPAAFSRVYTDAHAIGYLSLFYPLLEKGMTGDNA
jgi:hypothetical protein